MHQRFIALLLLLGWLFATGHMALDHGGVADGGVHLAMLSGAHDDGHDDAEPSQDGEHHHHDLSVMHGGQWMKSAQHKTLAPVWVLLFDALAARRTVLIEVREPCLLPTGEHAPPDERASGWLLVVQTAHPVRGPSLAV